MKNTSPALDLHIPWFPTYLSTFALRHFHRPVLKIKANGSDTTGWITISSLVKQINKKEKVSMSNEKGLDTIIDLLSILGKRKGESVVRWW